MSRPVASEALKIGPVYKKDTLIKGQPAKIECFDFNGQTYVLNRGLITTVSLEDEWYEDVRSPYQTIEALKTSRAVNADIFTFWQRLPDLEPKYPEFHHESEYIAALPVISYDHWWNHQLKSRVRSLIRKSEKEGVVVRETNYDDEFVRGLTAIFNESPIRQGRRFWHYGKDFDTVKRQFSRYIQREYMLAAYYRDQMIGAIMLGNAGTFGITGQIIASLDHRDKSPNNTLIAKAVGLCEKRGLGHLCYLYWSDDSLAEFKRRCGFERLAAPRYYVPLTTAGRLALKCGAHRGWKSLLPPRIKAQLKRFRTAWNKSNN